MQLISAKVRHCIIECRCFFCKCLIINNLQGRQNAFRATHSNYSNRRMFHSTLSANICHLFRFLRLFFPQAVRAMEERGICSSIHAFSLFQKDIPDRPCFGMQLKQGNTRWEPGYFSQLVYTEPTFHGGAEVGFYRYMHCFGDAVEKSFV